MLQYYICVCIILSLINFSFFLFAKICLVAQRKAIDEKKISEKIIKIRKKKLSSCQWTSRGGKIDNNDTIGSK